MLDLCKEFRLRACIGLVYFIKYSKQREPMKNRAQAKVAKRVNPLKFHLTHKTRTICEQDVLTFRPTKEVIGLINAAVVDFPNRTSLINAALLIGLKAGGYKVTAASAEIPKVHKPTA